MKRTTKQRPMLAMIGLAASTAASGLFWTAPAAHAATPGINGKLACATNRDGNFEIYTFNPIGTELQPTRLTNNSASDGRPRYSPDGRQIAFESFRDGPSELYIMQADGSNVHRLTFSGVPGVHGNSSPSWSPGGDQIAYQSTRDGNFEVYKVNVDGTGDTRLTNNPVEDSLPAWSPNGDKIAFSSRRTDPNADVMLMNPDGTGVVDISNSPGEDSWPTWSPDGSMIAFHSRRDDPAGEEIYRMNADGSNVVRLTFNTGPVQTSFDIFPAWSPDGTRIAWNSGRAGVNFGEVYTLNAVDGSDVRRVTDNPAIDQRCDWQPLCTIYGSGNILGTAGPDIICGSDGADSIYGAGGNDRVLGLGGNDKIAGRTSDEKMFGGLGDDTITGGGGNDILDGGLGSDKCSGGPTVRNCEAVG